MNQLTDHSQPPQGEGWIAPSTCGGGWTRLRDGIFETWPPAPGVTILMSDGAPKPADSWFWETGQIRHLTTTT